MNPTIFAPGLGRCGRWLVLCAVFAVSPAEAIVQEIKATFSPDPAYPHRNMFINRTPVSGYCADKPAECEQQEMFSIRLPVRFDSMGAMQPNGSARNSAMFSVPAQWRPLTVTNRATGEVETVEMRIAGIGSRYALSDTTMALTGAATAVEGHNDLWGGPGYSWVNSAPPCVYSGVGLYGSQTYAFFWKTPVVGACVKTARFVIPSIRYDYLDFAYELKTPNPLKMSAGVYTGDLSYRIGPGGDFDMGDVMVADDSDLTLSFTLDVQHTLKVDIPPGGESIKLVPVGGWQSWLQAGRKPVRLMRDQTFNISASSRFKMFMECEQSSFLYDCQLRDSVARRGVELQVSVSLPSGLTDMAGQSVRHARLKAGAQNALYFQPGFYVDRAPGVLHFEVPPEQMAFMLSPGVGPLYRGKVTVIWDSEV